MVEQVEFFVNGVSIAVDTTAEPFSTNFILGSPGFFDITATGTDNDGNSVSDTNTIESIAVSGVVPSVIITDPLDGAGFPTGTTPWVAKDDILGLA